jgi:putative tryptophan/tyrosine transport system substrate-binding protein
MNKIVMGLMGLSLVFASVAFSAETINVGVAWDIKSSKAELVVKGMQEVLKESAPTIQLEICKETGTGDKFAEVAKRFEKEKKAMVLLRSDMANYLIKNPPSIPAFVGACNHPTQLGLIKNANAPEGKVTGTTYYLPAATQFETFKAIFPQMKSVMLLLEKGHAGTPVDQAETKAICEKLKLEYKEAVCQSKEELIAAIKENADKVSVFLMGNERLVFDNTAELVAAAPKTPFISYSADPAVKSGAVCGFAADDVKLGRLLGESLIDVLIKGKPIKEVPVKIDTKPKLYISTDTAEKLGVKIPFAVLKAAEIVKPK